MKKYFLIVCATLALLGNVNAQSLTPGSALVLYDSSGDYGWLGGLYAKMLGNLLGHFPLLSYEIKPVESYVAGDVNLARATFYFGSVYDNPLPAAFTNDLATTTNTVCWFKYNIWQIDNAAFEAKTGFAFNWLDWTGYSNVVYKAVSFTKNQLDPELGYVSVLDTNLASVPAIATKADGTSIPYITHGGNFWYVSDVPFDYISEEDRYVAFSDALHDMIGIDAPVSHSAVIRIEDVAPTMYDPATLRAVADLLYSNNVPFTIALVPVYTDPLGVYNGGVAETHRISDSTDSQSVQFLAAIRYMVSKGAQLIIHGYTHQYSNVDNPYTGVSGDDFEFWRETLDTNDPANPFAIGIYAPVAEDSAAWTLDRLNAAKQELAQAGLSSVAFESPHYAASAVDYQVIATNFPLTMHRALYFDDAGHIAGQFFPYNIYADIYGQSIIPENLGNIEPTVWMNYPARSADDMVRVASKNLVVRDGWACGYFHPFYDLTNLQAIVTGVKALGYTYVPISAAVPPSITSEPVSQAVPGGSNAVFSVSVVGTDPLAYQWLFNGVNLAGGTDTLTVAGVQAANAGNYSVIISNAFGVVTSTVASLTVQIPPSITAQPASRTNTTGTTATFSVTAAGSATLRYQWSYNGIAISNATTRTLTITNVQPANSGGYSVVVTNAYGSVTSGIATLVVGVPPAIKTQPASHTNLAGTVATFMVVATGDATLGYQWRLNGTAITGSTSPTLTLNNVQPIDAGTYTVIVSNSIGSVTSASAVLTVGAPAAITAQPVSSTNAVGSTATFSVTATGNATLRYQWRKNGANISGDTSATLTLNNVQTGSAGTYSVVVTNAYGSVTSGNAVLTVVTLPAITTQPKTQTVKAGATASFSVVATGTATLGYQWKFNGTNIAGASSASLSLANVSVASAGNYTVVVSNPYGSATSAAAVLTVTVAPVITTQPHSVTNVAGTSATFSVAASGTSPFTYQWKFNGANISGATGSSYTRANVQAATAGTYTVVVSNAAGSATSGNAVLTVVTLPAITTQPKTQTVKAGATAGFSVVATGTATLGYQWKFNGTNISGAIGASLSLAKVQAASAGNYTVVVSNPYGSATSATATLTVQ